MRSEMGCQPAITTRGGGEPVVSRVSSMALSRTAMILRYDGRQGHCSVFTQLGAKSLYPFHVIINPFHSAYTSIRHNDHLLS